MLQTDAQELEVIVNAVRLSGRLALFSMRAKSPLEITYRCGWSKADVLREGRTVLQELFE
jgi:hypothetical protein